MNIKKIAVFFMVLSCSGLLKAAVSNAKQITITFKYQFIQYLQQIFQNRHILTF